MIHNCMYLTVLNRTTHSVSSSYVLKCVCGGGEEEGEGGMQ